MDVARLNLSHGAYELHEQTYQAVRQASDESGRAVGVLVDLQGPKIRLGNFAAGPVELLAGDAVHHHHRGRARATGTSSPRRTTACRATRAPATGS